jgi:hypothetical protein
VVLRCMCVSLVGQSIVCILSAMVRESSTKINLGVVRDRGQEPDEKKWWKPDSTLCCPDGRNSRKASLNDRCFRRSEPNIE